MEEEQPLVNEDKVPGIFKKGDTIVANYRRLGAYYTGKIGAVNGDGTYNIFYDDGEEEENVSATQIIHLPPTVLGRPFKEGDRVLANFRGGGKLFPGHITRCHRNPGSAFSRFDVKYDDNSSENDVLDYNLRFLARAKPPSPSSASALSSTERSHALSPSVSPSTSSQRRPSMESQESAAIQVYDRIEALHSVLQRYIPGHILAIHDSPTSYDVEFDKDSLKEGVAHIERTISHEDVRLLPWRIGDVVQVDFRGRGKFFPGRIQIVHQEHPSTSIAFFTYDIAYDDGDFEAYVSRRRIRPRHGTASITSSTTAPRSLQQPLQPSGLSLVEEDSIGCFCCHPNVTKHCPLVCCCCIAWVNTSATCRFRFMYRTCWRTIARTCCCYCFGCCGGWCPWINVQVGDYPHFSDHTDCWWDWCYCGCPDTR